LVSSTTASSVDQFYMDVCFSSDGDRVLAGCTDHKVALFDLQGKTIVNLMGHSNRVTSVCFHSHKGMVFSGSWDRQLKGWDLVKGQTVTSVNCKQKVLSLSASSQDPYLGVGLSNGAVRIYSALGGEAPLYEVKSICD
jgi:WD40 repeat protein